MTLENLFLKLAAAYVRGQKLRDLVLPNELVERPLSDLSEEDFVNLCQLAKEQGLRLHAFKRTQGLPRVKSVLGTLRGVVPTSLLDVGSGRGVFLWPLLAAFPSLNTESIDLDEGRIEKINAVQRGGIENLSGQVMDVCQMSFDDDSFEVVTALEVLEHIPDYCQAIRELVRVATRFVLLSVPSKEDDNPEHIHLFSAKELERAFLSAGASSVSSSYVLNHLLLLVRIY